MASGHLLYDSKGSFHVVAFDAEALEVRGDPAPLYLDVIRKTTGRAELDVSADGSLVYVAGELLRDRARHLAWVDRSGRVLDELDLPGSQFEPRLSPQGDRIIYTDVNDGDAWVYDLERETRLRITFDRGLYFDPIWTLDGEGVLLSSPWSANIYVYSSRGVGDPRLVAGPASGIRQPRAITPDGKYLVYGEDPVEWDIGMVELETPTEARVLLGSPFNESVARLSPSGRWLAYTSDESGRTEVYVRPFPNVETGRWPISVEGGHGPLWSKDGRELFYRNPSGAVLVSAIDDREGFRARRPEMLFEWSLSRSLVGGYDVSVDGQRFLMEQLVEGTDEAAGRDLILVQNWLEEIKRLVPAD